MTRAQAQAQIDGLIRQIAKSDPEMRDATPLLQDVRTVLYPTGRPIMRFLLAAAMLVLLVGCVNLATMLLGRSKRRERDIATRIALGATRARLVRPVVIESLMLGLAGALLAVGVTRWTFDALLRQVPAAAYGAAPVGVSWRVVCFALALGCIGGLAFGVVPAWRLAKLDAHALMQSAFARRGQRRGAGGLSMVAAQVALAIVLVFGAVVAGRAFLSVLRVPLGFQSDGIVTVNLRPRGITTPLAMQDFFARAVEMIARRPDVLSAGAAGALPLDGSAPNEGVGVRGQRPVAGIVHVLPGYFETAGIRLLRGRLIRWDDVRTGSGAAIVSEGAARLLFAGRDPIGASFSSSGGRAFTVVGVVANVKSSFTSGYDPALTYAIGASQARRFVIVARTRGRSEASLAGIRRDISRLAAGTPIDATWWSDDISAITTYQNPRFQTIVLVSFALLALVLTAIGTFAAISMLVATRIREMGVRMAMGATPESLVRLMVLQAARPVIVGLAIGLLSTRWLARLAQAQLFAVDTRDPVVLAGTAATVVLAALVAAWLPARHAGQVDPVVVLRAE